MFSLAFLTFITAYYAVPTVSPYVMLICLPDRRYLAIAAFIILCILSALFTKTRRPSCDEYSSGPLNLPWLRDIVHWAFALYALALGCVIRLATLHLRSRKVATRGAVITIHCAFLLFLLATPFVVMWVEKLAGIPPLFCREPGNV